MKKILIGLGVFVCLVVITIFGLAFISYEKPTPIVVNGQRSIVLTDTALLQLQSPKNWLDLVFQESWPNPYVYGWKDGTLYFKDSWERQFSWKPGQEKPQLVTLQEVNFLRQQPGVDCNVENRPTYRVKNYPSGIDSIKCTSFTQGNVKVELWPMEKPDFLSFTMKQIAIEYHDKKIIIDEPRLVSDVVISEDERYVVITASGFQEYSNGFAPTDIYVVELQ